MTTKMCVLGLALLSALQLTACDFLFDEDEEVALTAMLRHYVGDEMQQETEIPPGEARAITTACDRPIELGFNDPSGVTKIELVREIAGVTTTCDMLSGDGSVMRQIFDWPATTTVYTLRAHTDEGVLEFGPFTVTVTAVDDVVIGHAVHLGDQAFDGSGYGCFLQTRHAGWGGGWTYPNFDSMLAEGVPRLLDFATVDEAGVLKAISPDLIPQAQPAFTALANDCGFMTTSFAEYTGSLDPELADLTLAEVNALPDPPATATSLSLVEDLRFVYRTQEGKKGLVKVVDVVDQGTGRHFDLFLTTAK